MSNWEEDGIKQAHTEAGGMFEIYVLQPEEVDELLLDALFGDALAARLIGPVTTSASRILSAPHARPMLCLTCPRPVRGRTAVCLVMPYRDDATATIGSGLCTKCAALAPEALNARILAALRRNGWSDARTIGRVSKGPEAVQ